MIELTFSDMVGTIAACFTTGGLIPQVYRTVKTKRTHDLSLGMYFMLTIGVSLWFSYGILIQSYPIIIANSLSATFSSIILIYKLHAVLRAYRQQRISKKVQNLSL